MKCNKDMLLLYAVTDRAWTKEKSLYEQVEEALKGGASCIQLREKNLSYKAFLNEAYAMGEMCRAYKVPFIINDNVQIAKKCGADGVHVGQHDMAAYDVRKIIGDKMLLGVSVQTVEQASSAVKNGADYLGVGAVFPTSTKDDADSVPFETLRAICDSVDIPVVAIGGINKNNISLLRGSGIDGVALVSAVFASSDIRKECEILKKLSEDVVGE